LDLGRSALLPHFLHLSAREALRALHFIHIFLLSILFSASGNLAMLIHLDDME
jgi:hypothetical protein